MTKISILFSVLLATFVVSSCGSRAGTSEHPTFAVDPGERYVKLALALDVVTDGGFLFEYRGPEAWKIEASEQSMSLADIEAEARALVSELSSVRDGHPEQERLESLRFQVRGMIGRIKVLLGETKGFNEEAQEIFGVSPPQISNLQAEAALARLNELVPGEGDLAERVAAFKARMRVPDEKLEVVYRAAVEACRDETAKYIDLPAGEGVELVFVDQLPAAGRYDYLGDFQGRVTINRATAGIGNALYIGCHEAYPGHHLRAILREAKYGRHDWPEFDALTLFGPDSLLSEGLGQYAVDLAFPLDARTTYYEQTLFPLAGLEPADAALFAQFNETLKAVEPYATIEVPRAYLDGRMTRDEAIDAQVRYGLQPRERMAGMFGFVDAFRTYVITYSLGERLVETLIGDDASGPETHWSAFKSLNEAMVTPDLLAVKEWE
ncbi:MULTISPECIES: hypothetical protein [Henriciella]|jgi:hypothetical protein|uniref:DUF885 domain-containing protein n=1 Tax=Henriciella pelagia TaxID=1977912 RepID=A0ABQ1JB01_9PROT|nr:hypothetical protein [Henriciella pelagia]GGB61836.1 hypothetical protein GCM10011503_08070 [Henriciella pelagia]